jgi:hypothetical protein
MTWNAALKAKPIFCALLASLSMVTAAASFERWMRAEQIKSAFAGQDVAGYYADGTTFTESYGSDGRIDYREANRRMTGSWSVVSDTFCTIYDTSPTGGCYRVQQASPNCYEFYFVARDEREAAAPDPKRPSWTARGWRRNQPSTCAEAPTV